MAMRDVALSADDIDILLDALQALEYWEYATELDLPRRNGQVFLPSDDATQWRHHPIGADEDNAIVQIQRARALAARLLGAG